MSRKNENTSQEGTEKFFEREFARNHLGMQKMEESTRKQPRLKARFQQQLINIRGRIAFK